MKIFIVKAEHWAVSGVHQAAVLTPEAANDRARKFVNQLIAEVSPGGDFEIDPNSLPALATGDDDWEPALHALARAILLDREATLTLASIVTDQDMVDLLNDRSNELPFVWIEEHEVEDVPEGPAVVEDFIAAGQRATELLFDANDPEATAAGEKLGEALQMIRWALIWTGQPTFPATLSEEALATLQGGFKPGAITEERPAYEIAPAIGGAFVVRPTHEDGAGYAPITLPLTLRQATLIAEALNNPADAPGGDQ
jgi:hypothetical protein